MGCCAFVFPTAQSTFDIGSTKIRQRITSLCRRSWRFCTTSSWTQGAGPGFDHPLHRFFPLGSTYGTTRTCLLLWNVIVSSGSPSSYRLHMTTLVRHVTIWIVAGQVDQTSSWVIEREAASFEYSAVRFVTVLVLRNELGRND